VLRPEDSDGVPEVDSAIAEMVKQGHPQGPAKSLIDLGLPKPEMFELPRHFRYIGRSHVRIVAHKAEPLSQRTCVRERFPLCNLRSHLLMRFQKMRKPRISARP